LSDPSLTSYGNVDFDANLNVDGSATIDGTLNLGAAGNQITTDANGDVTMTGSATYWDDVVIDGLAVRPGGTAPGLAGGISGGLYLYAFDAASDESVHFTVQLPHGYKEGSTIYPHIHWYSPQASTNVVRWGLEYQWANVAGTFSGSTVYAEPANAGLTNQLADFTAITGTSKTISSILVCRLFRDADHANDTFAYDASLLSIDFHVEMDTLGSHEVTTKGVSY
jgi:hypothetical protein